MTLLALMLLAGCGPDFTPRTLEPYPNPFGRDDPRFTRQPVRDHPQEVVALGGGRLAVSLPGTFDEAGHEIAVVEGSDVTRIDTEGGHPVGLALHPNGRALVVTNPLSNFLTVVDSERGKVTDLVRTDFYTTEAAFTPDGRQLLLTNRWHDTLEIWDVRADGAHLEVRRRGAPVPVGVNPRDLAVSEDGSLAAVAALTGGTVSVIDIASRSERMRVDLGAPANDVVFAEGWLVVATLSRSTHHEAHAGPDTDGDGLPGDGTPNVNFQDLQNELAVLEPNTGEEVWRYTSDTLCCKDYRDVDPDDTERLGHLLPPSSRWIVGGSLPEQLAVASDAGGTWVYVTYSASNQVQRFAIDGATGALSPADIGATAHNPHGITVDGGRVWVAQRLSESVAAFPLDLSSRVDRRVGRGGRFPATDAEIGELFNFVTAPFTVDGDGSCTHCHREGGNIDKAFSMPLTAYGGVGNRMTMAYRGAADTRPWFFESAFDETNFKPVMNEFARIENFCCTDYTLFDEGAPASCSSRHPACADKNAWSRDGFDVADRDGPGKRFAHARPTAYATRDAFYRARADEVMGRVESFGDGVFWEDPITGTRQPRPLDFEGITQALGLFLLQEPRLPPNPHPRATDAVRRGKALFESAETGCAACHPAPAFTVSPEHNPAGVPLRMGPVVTPNRDRDGNNLDLFATGFLQAFPAAEQESCAQVCGRATCADDDAVCDDLRDVRFGVPSLRGIWDRAPSMLHDGRARGLREVLATPGHPILEPGERGFNERDGVPDTHGGTSHLSAAELGDLIAYIESL